MCQIVDNLRFFENVADPFIPHEDFMTYAQTLGVLKHHSMPSLVQEELERMLRRGAFAPGDPLREASLATQLGVSRGPIREAFRSLEEKGLVRVEKNRGVFVRIITPQEADDIFEVRTALEELIVSRLAGAPACLADSGLPELLNKAEKLSAKADFSGCHALNVQFHERLAELAGNATLLHTYRRLVNELSLFRQQAHARSPDASTLRQSVADHRNLFTALIEGDKRKALRVLKLHVEESRKRLKTILLNPSNVIL
ncbi:MAG: GntR family transcriptional regulator [Rhodoferax sp.]|nr:GntR family transcriptional regulator [Rhodoferax sp.]